MTEMAKHSSLDRSAKDLIDHAPHSSKIYTRHGDQGSSFQIDGTFISKSNSHFDALGTLDTAQSWIGVIRASLSSSCHELDEDLCFVQQKLYQLQSDVAVKGCHFITDDDVCILEKSIDHWMSLIPPINAFILPGGGVTGAQLHYARTLVRTAERACVAYNLTDRSLSPADLAFVNRLSDYLFAMARYANHCDGISEQRAEKPQVTIKENQ